MESLDTETTSPAEIAAEAEPSVVIDEAGAAGNNDERVKKEDASAEATPEFEEVSILAVRDTVLFPNALSPLSVGRPTSVALVESLGENRLIGVVSQIDPRTDVPSPTELHETGTVAIIHKIVRMREGQLLFCEGVSRMRIRSYTSVEPFLRARIERMPEIEPEIGRASCRERV